MSTNPLLDFSDLPRFADIRPEHVTPALDALLPAAQAAVDGVAEGTGRNWADVVEPLNEPLERLSRAWGLVGHLQAVVDTPELRAAYNDNLPRVTEFYTRLNADLRLFERYKAIAADAGYASLSAERKTVVEHALRDFRLGGAELTGEKRERFAAIAARLAEISQKFSEHLLDATNAWSLLITDAEELRGLPQDALDAAAEAATADGATGYKLTLHIPSYLPVMQYCENRSLRETVYRAYVTRASELADPAQDNSALMVEILALRDEQAKLLGYPHHAALSLVPKMAQSAEQVIEFVRDMARRAKPYAERDMAEIRDFGRAALGIADVQAWDVPFISEKLRLARYSYSDTEVKQYFTEPQVMSGLFKVISTLFDVQIDQVDGPVWHNDVRLYRFARKGQTLAHVYVDNYARNGKRGGAWMDVCRVRRQTAGQLQTPVAYVNCNFASPVGGKPALLTHDDVITLFHEYGHALHHLLTQVNEPGADMRAVEWDAIELPSQFMENFCWEWDVVRGMTRHADTGAELPRELFDKMLAAKNFQAGMQSVRQMEFALCDMRLHSEAPAATSAAVQKVIDEVRAEVAVVTPPAFNRFQHSFSHIFAGGYSAGYYSYKWAEVMSADAFSLFEETGTLNPATGRKFRDEVLAVGATRPAAESFRAFRGRDPQPDALLRHYGMLEAA